MDQVANQAAPAVKGPIAGVCSISFCRHSVKEGFPPKPETCSACDMQNRPADAVVATPAAANGQQDVFILADQLAALKLQKDALKQAASDVQAQIDETDARLAQAMLDEELGNFKRNGITYYIMQQVYVSPADKPKLYEHLKQVAPGMVQETVNANTLRAWTKEQIANNDGDLPEELTDLVNVTEKPTVGMRKSK